MAETKNSGRAGLPRWVPLVVVLTLSTLLAVTYPHWRLWFVDAPPAAKAENDHHDHQGHDGAAHDHSHGEGAHGHDEAGHEAEGESEAAHDESAHKEADHDHTGHDHADPNHLDLSPQAQRNLGLKVGPVELQAYDRTITIPGIVVERPGRTTVAVAAPLSGIVERVIAVEGEAVAPGAPLFEVGLTHEEIVQAQGEFLKTAVELDVIGREVARLEALSADGAIAGKTLLERKYEQEKQQAVLQAQREALLLHGFSETQVDDILRTRKLLAGLTVYAPGGQDAKKAGDNNLVWQIQKLNVSPGQHVDVGATLAELADYRTLFIEGKAFEQDAGEVYQAVEKQWPVSAVVDGAGSEPEQIGGLKVAYTSGRVDPESRAFHFYVTLPNRLLRDAADAEGHRTIDWQFKPGQRVELRVPVERWTERIVLPVGAVAREGPESYVFEAEGDVFHRRPVHEEYRDQFSVVIADDGSLKPGQEVALSGAQQMQIAIKNRAGGAPDPHAGHSH